MILFKFIKYINIRFTYEFRYVSSEVTKIPCPFHKYDLANKTIYRVCYKMSKMTGSTWVPYVGQNLLTVRITPSFNRVSVAKF